MFFEACAYCRRTSWRESLPDEEPDERCRSTSPEIFRYCRRKPRLSRLFTDERLGAHEHNGAPQPALLPRGSFAYTVAAKGAIGISYSSRKTQRGQPWRTGIRNCFPNFSNSLLPLPPSKL